MSGVKFVVPPLGGFGRCKVRSTAFRRWSVKNRLKAVLQTLADSAGVKFVVPPLGGGA